jgi:microsomal dipeptidase-like Zn-dependent dipeptidase
VKAFLSPLAAHFGVDYPRHPEAKAHCNSRPLSELGGSLIGDLMDNGMLIDVDHMSAAVRAATFDLAEARKYPGVVSGHSGFNAQLQYPQRGPRSSVGDGESAHWG